MTSGLTGRIVYRCTMNADMFLLHLPHKHTASQVGEASYDHVAAHMSPVSCQTLEDDVCLEQVNMPMRLREAPWASDER
jgi:hypothetical protein